MKIGIITSWCNHNYGAALQALALQRAIHQLIKNTKFEIIDFYSGGNYSRESSHLLYKPQPWTYPWHVKAREQYKSGAQERYNLFKTFYDENLDVLNHYENY